MRFFSRKNRADKNRAQAAPDTAMKAALRAHLLALLHANPHAEARTPDTSTAETNTSELSLQTPAASPPDPCDTLTLSEVECTDPACIGLETYVLWLRPGHKTRAAKVQKPMTALTPADLAALVSQLRSDG